MTDRAWAAVAFTVMVALMWFVGIGPELTANAPDTVPGGPHTADPDLTV